MGHAGGYAKRPGASSLVDEDAARPGPTAGPGKRTLVEQLNNELGEEDEQVPETGGAEPGAERAPATGGGKRRTPTEKVGTSLYAKDDQGRTLPPSIDDVRQGSLNDCFLFAAMAAIVHNDPGQITKMIKGAGKDRYTVTFFGTGFFSPGEETVSAEFVKDRHGGVGARGAYWPLVIEKAYAEHKGGLDELDKGGNGAEAAEDFTNDSASHFDPRDTEPGKILAKIAKAHKDKKPVTLGTPPQKDLPKEKHKMADDQTIHFWHVYTVVDVDTKGKRVKLFNPWGYEHPNGDGWISIDTIHKLFYECGING